MFRKFTITKTYTNLRRKTNSVMQLKHGVLIATYEMSWQCRNNQTAWKQQLAEIQQNAKITGKKMAKSRHFACQLILICSAANSFLFQIITNFPFVHCLFYVFDSNLHMTRSERKKGERPKQVARLGAPLQNVNYHSPSNGNSSSLRHSIRRPNRS